MEPVTFLTSAGRHIVGSRHKDFFQLRCKRAVLWSYFEFYVNKCLSCLFEESLGQSRTCCLHSSQDVLEVQCIERLEIQAKRLEEHLDESWEDELRELSGSNAANSRLQYAKRI